MTEPVTEPVPRPAPAADAIEAPFWARLRDDGSLVLQRCAACGSYRHPPRPVCAACGRRDLEWVPSPGRGEVWTSTIVHPPTLPAFAALVPYVAVVVRLDEGVFMVSRLVDRADVDAVLAGTDPIGRRVQLAATAVEEGVVLPLARLLPGEGG